MKKIILIALICLSIIVPVIAKQVSFDPSRGLVEVNVLIDGVISGRFGIDTGADRLYLNKQFAIDNSIEILQSFGQRNIQGADGSAKPFAASLKTFEIAGDVELKNVAATVVDLTKMSVGTKPPDGLIGYQILKQFYVSVDYPNSKFELSKDEPGFLRGRRYSEIPFSQYSHLILVDVVLNDDITVPMLLDYCASYTTITPKVAEMLEIPLRENRRAILESVQIGEVESRNVYALVSDLKEFKKSTPRAKFEGIIGSTFLHDFNITVDYKQKKVYVRH